MRISSLLVDKIERIINAAGLEATSHTSMCRITICAYDQFLVPCATVTIDFSMVGIVRATIDGTKEEGRIETIELEKRNGHDDSHEGFRKVFEAVAKLWLLHGYLDDILEGTFNREEYTHLMPMN